MKQIGLQFYQLLLNLQAYKNLPLKNAKEIVYYQLMMYPTHAARSLITQESGSALVSFSAQMVTYAWDNISAVVPPAD